MVILPYLHKADVWLLLLINGLHTNVLDAIMPWISTNWFWLPIWIWVAFLWLRKLDRICWLPVLLSVILVVITDQTSSHILKPLFQRLRPCWNPELYGQLYVLSGVCGGKFGFVSSHAANTAGFMVFAGILLQKAYLRWIMAGMVILVGFSRIYLAVHYPFDVVMGWLLGVVLGQLMVYVYYYFIRQLL